MTALPSPSWAKSLSALLVVAGCGSPGASPYSKAETGAALAPARDLRARCYAGGELERAGRSAVLDYELNVEADGKVRSLPVHVQPENPALVECVRLRLNQLRFPARGWDRVTLHFELTPQPPSRDGSLPRVRREGEAVAGTCDPPCADGWSCHYEPSHAAKGECRVATGRCRFDRDCPSSQGCQRLSERLGVCAERGP